VWVVTLPNAGCGRIFYEPRDASSDAPGLDAPGLDAPGLDAPGLDAPGLDAPELDAPVADDAPSLDAPSLDVDTEGGRAPRPDGGPPVSPLLDASAADAGRLPPCVSTLTFSMPTRLPISMSPATGVSVLRGGTTIAFSVADEIRLADGPFAASSRSVPTAGLGDGVEFSLDGSILYYDRIDRVGMGYATRSGILYTIGPGLVSVDDPGGLSVDGINLDVFPGGVVFDDYGNLYVGTLDSDTAVIDAIELSPGFEQPTTLDGEDIFCVPRGTGQIVQYLRSTGMTRPVLGLGSGVLSDPELSEDGQQLFYVRDGELWVASRACALP